MIAFAEYWSRVVGQPTPGCLCFDSQLTTYAMLDELCARGITFLTLRQRGQKVLEALAALPPSAWSTHTIKRSGRYRRPQIHEEVVRPEGRRAFAPPDRHPQHRSRTTHPADHQRPHRHRSQGPLRPLRRADDHRERTRRRHLRLPPQRPVIGAARSTSTSTPRSPWLAGNCYRLLARKLPRYELATPDRLWRHFLDNTGTVTVADDHVRVDLALRTYTPVLIDAGFPELDMPIPWWGGRTLRFGFPPR